MPETTQFTGMESGSGSESSLKANFVLHNRYKILRVLGGGGMGAGWGRAARTARPPRPATWGRSPATPRSPPNARRAA